MRVTTILCLHAVLHISVAVPVAPASASICAIGACLFARVHVASAELQQLTECVGPCVSLPVWLLALSGTFALAASACAVLAIIG
jgi:hypothetical protein